MIVTKEYVRMILLDRAEEGMQKEKTVTAKKKRKNWKIKTMQRYVHDQYLKKVQSFGLEWNWGSKTGISYISIGIIVHRDIKAYAYCMPKANNCTQGRQGEPGGDFSLLGALQVVSENKISSPAPSFEWPNKNKIIRSQLTLLSVLSIFPIWTAPTGPPSRTPSPGGVLLDLPPFIRPDCTAILNFS